MRPVRRNFKTSNTPRVNFKYILAGLDFESTEERKKYYFESLRDLQINIGIADNKPIDK